MPQIYLLRDGKASSAADNYDQLSDIGYCQLEWLRDWFSVRNIKC
jgi:hypothetical protein